MRYMLDTDSVSYALRGHGNVATRLLQETPSAVCVSSLSVAELRFGAHKRGSRKLGRLIDTFLASITVQPFDEAAANVYGRLAAQLLKRGQPIGQVDALLAAHAISLGLTMVTNNDRHFGKVPGLTIENWV